MIISFDPSINVTGWAVGERGQITESGVIKTGGHKISVPARLQKLHESIIHIRTRHVCIDAVVEVPGSFTYARSARGQKSLNAASIALLNQAVGVVLVSLSGCKIHLVVANEWKGKMTKEMSCRAAGVKDHNEADAINLLKWFEAGGRR